MANDDRIRALLAEFVAERDAILAESEPLKEKRRAVQAQMHPLEAQVRELTQQIVNIETDELVKLDKNIGNLSKSLGARSLSAQSMDNAQREE